MKDKYGGINIGDLVIAENRGGVFLVLSKDERCVELRNINEYENFPKRDFLFRFPVVKISDKTKARRTVAKTMKVLKETLEIIKQHKED